MNNVLVVEIIQGPGLPPLPLAGTDPADLQAPIYCVLSPIKTKKSSILQRRSGVRWEMCHDVSEAMS